MQGKTNRRRSLLKGKKTEQNYKSTEGVVTLVISVFVNTVRKGRRLSWETRTTK